MKKKLYATAIVIIFAIFAIILILAINKKFNKEVTEEPPVTVITLSNVYILSSQDGIIQYLNKGEIDSVTGSLDQDYQDFTGIADIVINSNKELVEVIDYKSAAFSGTLLAYTDDRINISGQGWMDFSKNAKVYRTYEGTIESFNLKDLVVGASILSFFTDESGVCACVQNEKTVTDQIRVVIKNDDTGEIFYNELYLYSKGPWTVNGQSLEVAKTFDVANYMRPNHLSSITISSESPIAICDENGKKKSQYYQGTLDIINEEPEVAPNGDDIALVLVNTLPIEIYVRYVLPSEMLSSFGYEAKKAQAVCARTYAYSQMKNGQYAAYGANLDDSTMYQVYNANGTSTDTDQACKETEGQVATCNDELITCYYFSTSPGYTHGLEAWGQEDVAYLGYHDLTGENYDADSPFYKWTATLDFDKDILSECRDEELGNLLSFKITGYTSAGYVNQMELTYKNGVKELKSELDVRRFFGKFMTKLTLNNGKTRTDFTLIPCAYFSFEDNKTEFEVSDITGETFIITGGGFGHGIGLSQYGASAMADAGHNYQEILNYYYDNISLSDAAALDVFK